MFDDNTVAGEGADPNQSGLANTVFGYEALSSNASGRANTAVGKNSLSANTEGVGNVGVGYRSLESTIGGGSNTSVGYLSLQENIDGSGNVVIGAKALQSADTGNRNTAAGYQSLAENRSRLNHTAVGADALFSTRSGEGNTGIGNKSMDTNSSGSFNTGLGHNTDVSEPDLSNATAIGANALVSTSNTIQLGDVNVTSVVTAGRLTSGDITLPNVDGSAGQILVTDGFGEVSWSDAPQGPKGDPGIQSRMTLACVADDEATLAAHLPNFRAGYPQYTEGTGLCLFSGVSVGITAPISLPNWWEIAPGGTTEIWYPFGSLCSGTQVIREPVSNMGVGTNAGNGYTYFSMPRFGSDSRVYFAGSTTVDVTEYKNGGNADKFTRYPNGTTQCDSTSMGNFNFLEAVDSGYSTDEFVGLWPWTIQVR